MIINEGKEHSFEKQMMKTPWFDSQNRFKIQSCLTAVKYIKHKTGIDSQVHKTDRYLVVNYVKNGVLQTFKVELIAGVLYCLKEIDFNKLFEQMNE